ncbi:Membrane protein involved in the export of O-antigen and teichoic acid [Singulisphaera sp. GP187]|uniref:oligosaccharide flippase family protein n=1 Tax=Singulisphaera sp. GP187 TaxID=1882752 RepID=UPI00092CC95F|nr:oligosaccharide flippase family protein [Singulisphaera sp. GP187]SIO15192.1 Membrane protein involved in the export of O-antigen and teichoic acid [Singulisphaera sp. GP187]
MTTTARLASAADRVGRKAPKPASRRPKGLRWVLVAELLANFLGFAVMVHLARRLGPASFARLEYAAAVAAWLLVVVRGGVDVIVYREAARRPSLIRPLTDVLIGLRGLAALTGYALVLGLALLAGPERGPVVAIAGLILFPSAWVTDVGLRVSGRFGWIALAQGVRSLAYVGLAVSLVRNPGDLPRAAWCLVFAEVAGTIVPLAWHSCQLGWPRIRFRKKAWIVVAHRGAIAGVTRFGRVSLYGADLLVLGWWASAELGSYAAARRIVFGFVALGLVLPASLAPAIARQWAGGANLARGLIEDSLVRIWVLSLPAVLVLMVMAGRWMPLLFGERYRGGGPWLVLIAARLPWLLTASFIQASLTACRRESWVFDQTVGLVLLALVLVPAAAVLAGPWGVGWALLAIEIIAAVGGLRMLAKLGLSPRWYLWRHRLRGLLP